MLDCKFPLFFLYFDIYSCICLNTSYYFLAVSSILNIVPYFHQLSIDVVFTLSMPMLTLY